MLCGNVCLSPEDWLWEELSFLVRPQALEGHWLGLGDVAGVVETLSSLHMKMKSCTDYVLNNPCVFFLFSFFSLKGVSSPEIVFSLSVQASVFAYICKFERLRMRYREFKEVHFLARALPQ